MAKILTYTVIMAGLWIFMILAGLNTGTHDLITAIGFDMTTGTFSWAVLLIGAIATVFILGAATGYIQIGFFGRQTTESSVVAPVATLLLGITFVDFASLIAYFFGRCPIGSECSPLSWTIATLFVVLWAGYLISLVQWWRGGGDI